MISFVFFAALFMQPQVTASTPQIAPPTDCRNGPVRRHFGGAAWSIFACNDGNLLLLAARGNPTFPAMMSVSVGTNGVKVSGPAYVLERARSAVAELRGLKAVAVGRIHAEATAAASAQP